MRRSAFLLAFLVAIGCARAQDFPNRPVTMVVPYPAGGVTDVMARMLGEKMQAVLGQSIVIDNVGGAAGSIAVGKVARSPADGYTMIFGNVETNLTNAVTQNLTYDMFKDFDPVVMAPSYPFLIVSKNEVPAKTLPELIAWLKTQGDKAFQATIGAGSAQHLCGARMQKALGFSWGFVPYRGSAQAIQDMLSGRFDIMCTATGSFLPHVREGKIRAYAVTTPARLEGAPDIPTVDEAGGLPKFYVGVWNAFWVPKGTPPAAIRKLNEAVIAAMKDPTTAKKLIDLGLDAPKADMLSPEALGAFHKAEADVWWPLMKDMGLTPQ
jgi:tripartite-type tricarboxylate transporter receptor subunit TctC